LIALDANIWISERLLRSATGAAFLHAIRRTKTRLLLPDVTRLEILVGVERAGTEAVKKVTSGFTTIQSLSGSRPDYHLPSPEDLRRAAEDRLGELDELLVNATVTMEHHNRALARVLEHRPPAETREQYRDCLLWEMLLDHHKGSSVLVSADTDFADKRSSQQGLAAALRQECGDEVAYFSSLADCLRAMEPQVPPMDMEAIRDAIVAEVLPEASARAQATGFQLGQQKDSSIELYATEDVGGTAAVFELVFAAFDLPLPDGTAVPEADLILSGDCVIREGLQVAELSMGRMEARALDGERLPFGVVYISAHSVIGVRQIPYRVRAPIPNPEQAKDA
jgi:PIN domain